MIPKKLESAKWCHSAAVTGDSFHKFGNKFLQNYS